MRKFYFQFKRVRQLLYVAIPVLIGSYTVSIALDANDIRNVIPWYIFYIITHFTAILAEASDR